jgi:hypothetical protein
MGNTNFTTPLYTSLFTNTHDLALCNRSATCQFACIGLFQSTPIAVRHVIAEPGRKQLDRDAAKIRPGSLRDLAQCHVNRQTEVCGPLAYGVER